jgi:hypothetical protein
MFAPWEPLYSQPIWNPSHVRPTTTEVICPPQIPALWHIRQPNAAPLRLREAPRARGLGRSRALRMELSLPGSSSSRFSPGSAGSRCDFLGFSGILERLKRRQPLDCLANLRRNSCSSIVKSTEEGYLMGRRLTNSGARPGRRGPSGRGVQTIRDHPRPSAASSASNGLRGWSGMVADGLGRGQIREFRDHP